MQICDNSVMDLNITFVQPQTNDYSNDYDVHSRGSLSGEHLAHMHPAEFVQGENSPPAVYAVPVSNNNYQFHGNATVNLEYISGNMSSSQASATEVTRRSHQTCRLRDRYQVHAQCEEDLIRENLRREEQRNFRLRQFFQCGCCLIRRKQLLLLPCEHLTCTDCPRDSDTCPICREPILRKQPVFFA